MFKSYIDPVEGREANKKLGRLMVEGLLLGGSGLGVLALIFEIAADAFSVAAYQTLLAIHGAEGHHIIAILAFMLLSVLLFLGIVPAYKAGSYLRPNAGGSGPLVEAIGPPKMRWLSWIGTSLFFLDAVLTIIISSISAVDVTMLLLPELAPYRIILAEIFAFFIMAVLVALGPKRAVPLFLIGGGAFTLFTLGALGMVGATAAGNPEWAFLTEGIVARLQDSGVVEEVVRAQQDIASIGTVLFFQLFFRSMSSAMLGFSGYEVIPASGKHAARPKWKVINTALTLAAVFLIGTGIVQLYAARQWDIPATEGYSTLLMEYEISAAQIFGSGEITESSITIQPEDRQAASAFIARQAAEHGTEEHGEALSEDEMAEKFAIARVLAETIDGTRGEGFLFLAGTLLAIILLLAQGGGYIGGAAVAANAARLGRLPKFFSDDRIGIAVIWGFSAILIPIIKEVVVVEAYYAFGFVSAFVITSTTVYFVRDEAMRERGIEPGSAEAKSLKFAGLRGMIASYFMAIVLITQKTDALPAIIIFGAAITLFQLYYANGGLGKPKKNVVVPEFPAGTREPAFDLGVERAHDQARQRGVVAALNKLFKDGAFTQLNTGPARIKQLVAYVNNVDLALIMEPEDEHGHIEEPSTELETTYQNAFDQQDKLVTEIEHYSHLGIFKFIYNYYLIWVDPEKGRDAEIVQRAMLNILFPFDDDDLMWDKYCNADTSRQPEEVWQFSRVRYQWAKEQWPNLSDHITTIWTLQDFGLIPTDIDLQTTVPVAGGNDSMLVNIPKNIKK